MEHPPETVERIIALASTGLSRATIATQVKMTRSAVCGVLFRKGIKTAKPAPRPKPAPSRGGRFTRSKKSKPVFEGVSKFISTEHGGIAWDDLTSRCCSWPVHDGLWCGAAKTDGSYCAQHFRMAYRKAA